MKIYGPISVNLREKRIKEKIKINISLHALPRLSLLTFRFDFILFLFFLFIIIWIHSLYCLIRIRFCPEKIYFFLVQFILNELNSSYFLTLEILLKISSLKSLATYHPENRKIFRLSQNSTKLFWVTRFRETNLTAQSVLSSEI